MEEEIILDLWLQFGIVSSRNCCGKQIRTTGGLSALREAEDYLRAKGRIDSYGMSFERSV
jgi:hypothetical protein